MKPRRPADDLEALAAGDEVVVAEEEVGSGLTGFSLGHVLVYVALLLLGLTVGVVVGGDRGELADLRAEVRSLRAAVEGRPPATVRQIDVRGPLLVANPCPTLLDAELRDDTGRPRWGGELEPGVTVVEQLAAITVSSEWSIDFALPGGSTSMKLGEWLSAGVVTVPALSCPPS